MRIALIPVCRPTGSWGLSNGMAGMYAAKVLTRNPLFRTFGDQASILNYLQSVSAMLKIAPKSLTCSNLFDPVFTKSADEPRNPLFRTFGDQASILNYLQSVSAMLKIAPKSLTCSNLFDPVFTKSADEPRNHPNRYTLLPPSASSFILASEIMSAPIHYAIQKLEPAFAGGRCKAPGCKNPAAYALMLEFRRTDGGHPLHRVLYRCEAHAQQAAKKYGAPIQEAQAG